MNKIYLLAAALMISSLSIGQAINNNLIDSAVAVKIQKEMEADILRFKRDINPELGKEKFRIGHDGYKGGRWALLPSLPEEYSMILDIEPWYGSKYYQEYFEKAKDFYLVTKKGNRFVNVEDIYDYKVRPKKLLKKAYSDTLSFDLDSKYFPYDERYLVFYYRAKDEVVPVSGDVCCPGPYLLSKGRGLEEDMNTISWRLLGFMRLERFNPGKEVIFYADDIDPSLKSDYGNYLYMRAKRSNFYPEPEKGFLIKMPLQTLGDNIEVTYYSNVVPTLYNKKLSKVDSTYKDKYVLHEIKYIVKECPQNFEETLPIIKAMSEKEEKALLNRPNSYYHRIFHLDYNDALRAAMEERSRKKYENFNDE